MLKAIFHSNLGAFTCHDITVVEGELEEWRCVFLGNEAVKEVVEQYGDIFQLYLAKLHLLLFSCLF